MIKVALFNQCSQDGIGFAVYTDEDLAVADEFLAFLYVLGALDVLHTGVRCVANNLHGVDERGIAVGVSGVGVDFDAGAANGELGEAGSTRLAEHTGEEVEVVQHVVVVVIVEDSRVGGVFLLHLSAPNGMK